MGAMFTYSTLYMHYSVQFVTVISERIAVDFHERFSVLAINIKVELAVLSDLYLSGCLLHE